MDRGVFLSFLFIITVFAGCSTPSRELSTPTSLPIATADLILPTNPPSNQTTAEENSSDDCLKPVHTKPVYQLDAKVDMKNQVLQVRQSVAYTNPSDTRMQSIRFVVDPNWHDGYFKLTHIYTQADKNPSYLLSGGFLEILLDSPLFPGCEMVFNLEFTLTLPAQPGVFGYTDNQTVLTNWFPFIPPYLSETGWHTHEPGTYGEYLVYPIADFEVSLTILHGSPDMMIAAPGSVSELEGRFFYRLDNARTFSFAMLDSYKTLEKEVDGVLVQVYYRMANPRAAHSALATLGSALTTFSDLFGPYPFDALSLVEIEMFDGMEYDGIFFLGQDVFDTYKGTARNLLTLLSAHETCHNWWFSQVGNDQAIEPWLDEALATYCEVLFLENEYPGLVGWWWDFRVNMVRPSGFVNATIYTYPDYEDYRQAIYLRGVQFLHAVRGEIGDESFAAFLQQYYSAGRNRVVSSETFFEILEKVYPIGIERLRSEYFSKP